MEPTFDEVIKRIEQEIANVPSYKNAEKKLLQEALICLKMYYLEERTVAIGKRVKKIKPFLGV